MTTITHTAVGYFLAQAFVQNGILPPELTNHAITLGMIAANAPDVDVLVYRRIIRHRSRSPFHKPVLWALVLAPLLVYFLIHEMQMEYGYLMLFSTGVLSHFICDSIDFSSGINWLWPLTNKRFHIWKYTLSDPTSIWEAINHYRHSPTAIVELATTAISYMLINRR